MRAEDINSLESESGIIATLIHRPEFSFYSEHLLPNHFSSKSNKCIYAAICALARRGIKNIDAYNIMECLSSSDATRRLSEEITVDNLQELVEMSDILARNTVEEYKMLVTNVMDSAFRRDAFQRLKECQALCYDKSVENVEQEIYNRIDDVMAEFSTKDDVVEFGEVIDELWEDIKKRQSGEFPGIPFKFPTLNEYVTIEPGELVVLGAPAKGAKSMFMLNEAADLLLNGKSVVYIDSELSDRLFFCRLLSHFSKIEFSRIKSGRYSPEEEEVIEGWIKWLKDQKFVHLYIPTFDVKTIYTAVKKIAHRFGKLDVLIVDYLKSTGDTDAFGTYAELGKLTDTIKNDLAGAMDIAALAAAQLKASGEGLADSAKITRNASTVLFLTDKSPDEIQMDGVQCGNKKLVVSRNRNGMQHVQGEWIDIQFDGNTCWLEEARQHIPQTPY